MKIITGIGASPGMAMGRAVAWEKKKTQVPARTVTEDEINAEIARFRSAVRTAINQLNNLKERAGRDAGQKEARIFDAHAGIVEDPAFLSNVEEAIRSERTCAEYAVQKTVDKLTESFRKQRFSTRIVADLTDVRDRLISILTSQGALGLELRQEAVVASSDLSPSDTALLDRKLVLALVTERGGVTSHTAILARAMGIPAVVAVGGLMSEVHEGDMVIVDGIEGTVILNPDAPTIERYQGARERFLKVRKEQNALRGLPAMTVDGHRVALLANIGSPEEASLVINFDADGVGLLRSEFSYMERTNAPTAEELFKAYRSVAEQVQGKKVVVRTLDIGGDKPLPYFPMPEERNPFLGYRGVRVSLARPELFKVQLEGVLRASPYGNLEIMVPMISTLEEVRQTHVLLEEVKDELRQQSVPFKDDVKLGIMVETPSAAVLADLLAKEVDFFSIGTNDLTQYVLAADRTCDDVAYLFDGLDPAVLRLVKNVIDAGHREGIKVAMCGELAADPVAAPILLGLGLDEFSIYPAGIPVIKKVLRSFSFNEAQQMALKVLSKPTAKEIRSLGRAALEKVL
jgi:phosphotransferase system enzyme I (PtsI)